MFYKTKTTTQKAAGKQAIVVAFIQIWDESRGVNCIFWFVGEHHMLPGASSLVVMEWLGHPNLNALGMVQTQSI